MNKKLGGLERLGFRPPRYDSRALMIICPTDANDRLIC